MNFDSHVESTMKEWTNDPRSDAIVFVNKDDERMNEWLSFPRHCFCQLRDF